MNESTQFMVVPRGWQNRVVSNYSTSLFQDDLGAVVTTLDPGLYSVVFIRELTDEEIGEANE